ncbi:hypothetical protein C8R45DRAFT_1068329 [Mycena sanguinolenta]|nr:hypothetical protein C8R45DRAFT_1068329 [Mycena sanguinolenta]
MGIEDQLNDNREQSLPAVLLVFRVGGDAVKTGPNTSASKARKVANSTFASVKTHLGSLPVKEGLRLYMSRVDCYLISGAEIALDVDSTRRRDGGNPIIILASSARIEFFLNAFNSLPLAIPADPPRMGGQDRTGCAPGFSGPISGEEAMLDRGHCPGAAGPSHPDCSDSGGLDLLKDTYQAVFMDEGIDLLLAPCTPTISDYTWNPSDSVMDKMAKTIGITLNTAPFNVSGHPAMSLPIGMLHLRDLRLALRQPLLGLYDVCRQQPERGKVANGYMKEPSLPIVRTEWWAKQCKAVICGGSRGNYGGGGGGAGWRAIVRFPTRARAGSVNSETTVSIRYYGGLRSNLFVDSCRMEQGN